ncbi:MAG: hypothetical protein J5687_06715 [Treponema sp.]|nr:hypothetical protein [Treponema sp.]
MVLVFAACNNFLNAGKVSDEIKDAIAYNNARSVNVALSCKEEEGSLFPQPTYQAKLGYDFEVQFIPNTDNYIVTENSAILKAVSRIDDESREEYVQFTPVEQSYEDKKSGLYRVKVKIVKYADDIKICPNGTLIPKVKEIYPPYNPAGYNQDTIVKITFNKPVDPQSFGDFSCISFESGTNDISSCYGTPYFSSDNTVLFIPPVPGKKIIDDQSQNNAAEVTLKINCTNLTDEDGLSIPQIDSYTYCVNKTVDSIAPTITSFEMTTTGDTNAWYYRVLTNKAFADWDDAEVSADDGTVKYYYGDYSRNHVGKSVHINLQGYDNADAVYAVRIREVFVKDSSGLAAGENEIISYYDICQVVCDENGNSILTEDGRTLYSFDFNYEFVNRLNGLIKLEISLMDGAGKPSEVKTTYVIKMSDISRKVSFTLEADSMTTLPQLVNGEYKSYLQVPEKVNNNQQDNTLDFTIGTADKFYGDYVSTCSSFKFIIYDKNNNPVTVYEKNNFQGNTNTSQSIKTEINAALANYPIDTYRDTKAKAVFYEANGIKKELDFTIPAPGEIISIQSGQVLSTNTATFPTAWYGVYYVTYQANENSAVTKTWTKNFNQAPNLSNITSKTESSDSYYDYKFGVYKIYVKESSLVGETVAEDCKIMRAFTKPFTYVKNPNTTPGFSFRPPQKKSCDFDNSTGMFHLITDVTYPQDEYLYYLVVVAGPWVYISDERANNVYFPYFADYQYMYYIVRKDPSKGYVGIGSSSNLQMGGNEDRLAPKFISNTNSKNGGACHYYDSAYFYIDDLRIVNNGNTNHYDDENGNVEFICYYLPVYVGENPVVDVLKNQCVYNRTIEFGTDLVNTALKSAKIPFADLNQGEYYLYAYLKDAAGNERCERLAYDYKTNSGFITNYGGVLFALKDGTPRVLKNTNDSRIQIFKPEGSTVARMYRYKLQHPENDDTKWVWMPMENNVLYDNNRDTCYQYDSSSTACAYAREQNSFIKVTACETDKTDKQQKFDFYHYKPLYYYSSYIYNPSSYPCNSATWMKVANGYQIFRDAPVFVHTMYSKIKITETAGEEDALEWEARAHETGLVVYTDKVNTSFTYKHDKAKAGDNLYEIPDGSWYTTICHFADGTVLMSPVEQMHK